MSVCGLLVRLVLKNITVFRVALQLRIARTLDEDRSRASHVQPQTTLRFTWIIYLLNSPSKECAEGQILHPIIGVNHSRPPLRLLR